MNTGESNSGSSVGTCEGSPCVNRRMLLLKDMFRDAPLSMELMFQDYPRKAQPNTLLIVEGIYPLHNAASLSLI